MSILRQFIVAIADQWVQDEEDLEHDRKAILASIRTTPKEKFEVGLDDHHEVLLVKRARSDPRTGATFIETSTPKEL